MNRLVHFGHKHEESLKSRIIVPPSDDCPFTTFASPYVTQTTPASSQAYPMQCKTGSSGIELSDLIALCFYIFASILQSHEIRSIPRRQAEVDSFLAENGFLKGVIVEALQQIEKYFGYNSQLALNLSVDPIDGSSSLLLLIQTKKKAAEALPVLDQFDEEWWFDNVDRARGLLTIKLEYV